MSREEQYLGYYNDILQGHSYIDTRLSIQTAVADFLAQTFFGKDFSRVIYTNPEYAFRKRIERLAHGIDENIFISNLELPFCSFNLSTSTETIKTAAASEWAGYYDETIDQRMHFINVLQKCNVQMFFNRSDDATVAFEIAQTEALAEAPIRYIQEVFWRNTTIEYPIWITVKKVLTGPDAFNESKWLEQNHMFAVTLELEIEIARIHIHRGLNAVQLPFKWHSTGNPDTWTNEDVSYYTQKCVVMWANRALGIDITLPDEPTKEATEINEALIKSTNLEPCNAFTIQQIQSIIPNRATAEMVEGYFRDNVKINFNRLAYVPEKSTIDDSGEVTAWLDFIVKPSTYKYWDYTEIYVPSRSGGPIQVKNCKDKYVKIDGLHPNSKYTIYLIAHDIEGNFNTIPLDITTPVWKKETLPTVKEDTNPSDLIPVINDETEKPVKVVAHGLIGLEL